MGDDASPWTYVIPALAVIAGVVLQVVVTWLAAKTLRRNELEDRADNFKLAQLSELLAGVSAFYELSNRMSTEKWARNQVAPGLPLLNLNMENLAEVSKSAVTNDILSMRIGDVQLKQAVAKLHDTQEFENLPADPHLYDAYMNDFRTARNAVVSRIGEIERAILDAHRNNPGKVKLWMKALRRSMRMGNRDT